MQNSFEITLRGASFSDVVAQARALVTEAEKFQAKTTPVAAPKAKAKAAPVIEESFLDDAEETSDDFGGFEEPEEPKKKEKKTPKITEATIQKAAAAYAKENSREAVYKILKKFKVKSVLELKESQYEDVMEALTL